MNRGGPTVAQSLPVDRYAGNCLIKPSSTSSYYCGAGGGVHHNAVQEPLRCRYDAVAIGAAAAAAAAGYHHHHNSPPTPYQHYQQLQDWYGRSAYWHHHQGGGGIAGGPLVEKANFAAHKHGAPLIQAAKYNRTGGGGGGVGGGGSPGKKYAKKAPAEQPNGGCKKNDGGSDESSGTASETSLPRIIKPRKRRKKERKPVPVNAAAQPIVVVVVEPERDAVVVDRPSSSSSSPPPSRSSSSPSPPPSLMATAPPSSRSSQPPRDAGLPFDTVRLSADIKAVSLEDVSTCQCACCDPVGNVWDVGRRCFSPSLTRPEPARRSWSGEPASFSTTLSLSKSMAGDYGKPEITAAAAPRARTHSLEVSSEIVTSHNGQRDIEIKFFTMPIGDRR